MITITNLNFGKNDVITIDDFKEDHPFNLGYKRVEAKFADDDNILEGRLYADENHEPINKIRLHASEVAEEDVKGEKRTVLNEHDYTIEIGSEKIGEGLKMGELKMTEAAYFIIRANGSQITQPTANRLSMIKFLKD